MTSIFAKKALTSKGWESQVRITTARGRIKSMTSGSKPARDDAIAGIVIPGLPNSHSHAFQRLLAGHTERRSPAGRDNFWSWRDRMYRLASRIDAERLRTIARQVYTEMVVTGYTSVAEFHYLHNQPGEGAASLAMFEALREAAQESGIRLTYVPVLYERAGFTAPEPTADQRRFVRSPDEFVAHYEAVSSRTGGALSIGLGVHSLRAVTATSLSRIARIAARDGVPMHLHIAEQQREVTDCEEALGARPVEWLLQNEKVDSNWCLVHATHVDDAEVAAIAAAGAVVCLCPSTEANLGDGLFPLQAFLEQGGRIAIGSDSHVSVNPFEELRWLEYGQRLVSQKRNVAAISRAETGRSLFELATRGGARACGIGDGQLAEGAPADLVVLDDDDPMLAGHNTGSFIDALVFSGFSLPIDRVMVNGEWQVAQGRHRNEDLAREDFRRVARAFDLNEEHQ